MVELRDTARCRMFERAGEKFGNDMFHYILQCLVVFMEQDNTLNDFNTRTTCLGYVVRGLY